MPIDVNGIGLEVADDGSGPAVLLLHGSPTRTTSGGKPPPALPPVSTTVLGAWASGDRFLTEESMTGSAEYVAGPWTYSRLEGPGHWMVLDAPDALNRLHVGFLSRVAAPAAAQPSSSST